MTAPEGFGPLRAAYEAAAQALASNLNWSIADRLTREEESAHDALADFASEHGLCYGCGEPDDTDGRATYCSTCDPIGAADRARQDADDAEVLAKLGVGR